MFSQKFNLFGSRTKKLQFSFFALIILLLFFFLFRFFSLYRQLAQISRSTRGVILMLCELPATRRIMSEAQHLNMVGGHFIWLWADTTSSTEFYDAKHSSDALTNNLGPTMHVNDTVPRSSKMNNRDVKNESVSMHTTRAPVVSSHASSSNGMRIVHATNATPIDEDVRKREELLNREKTKSQAERFDGTDDEEEVNLNFSEGFDPFRLKQRQYDKTRRQERFGQGNLAREKPLPANGLILGLHGSAGEQQNLGTDSHAKKNRRNINDANYGDHSDDNDDGGAAAENIFLLNQSNSSSVSSRNKSSDETNRNFSEHAMHSLDYSIDNNHNFNENPFKLKKRTSVPSTANSNSTNSTGSSPSSSSFVLYHHFKDFPIGLLAMRPQRMNIDRHFIRAAVRVFAATWAKIDAESKRQKYQSTVINAAAARNIGSSALRNLKNDRRQYERKIRRRRNIRTANDLLVAAVSVSMSMPESASAHTFETTQVNSSTQQQQQFNKNIATNISNLIRMNSSDLNANANAKIVLNDRNVNSSSGNSFNQNLSGLTKQSLTKSNTDRNVSAMRTIDASPDTIVAVARNVSKAIRRNYLFDANVRQRSNKRQNTWWSLEKETLEQQQRRGDPNAEHDAPVTCDTPRYLGGCYGTPNKQDFKNAEHFAR